MQLITVIFIILSWWLASYPVLLDVPFLNQNPAANFLCVVIKKSTSLALCFPTPRLKAEDSIFLSLVAISSRAFKCLQPVHLTSNLKQVCGHSLIDCHGGHVRHKMLLLCPNASPLILRARFQSIQQLWLPNGFSFLVSRGVEINSGG